MKKKMFVMVCMVMFLCGVVCATVTIDGNTTSLPWDNTTYAYVGNTAAGSMTANASGDAMVSRYTYLGYTGSGNGTVTMSGGSTLTTYMYNIAQSTGTTGSTTLNGAGTKIMVNREGTSYGSLTVGRRGNGTLEIKTGADVEVAATLTLCSYYSTTATLTVDGAGSTLTTGGYMTIGGNSTTGGTKAQAYVNVTNGGSIVCNDTSVDGVNIGYGSAARNQATALVDGEGSVWSAVGKFTVGRYGNGTLTITDGGLVKVGGTLWMNTSATGALIKMDTEGMLALKDAGNLGSSDINAFLGLISCGAGFEKDIKYWNGTAWDSILYATAGVDYNIAHYTTGDFADYTVLTIPEPATIGLLGMGMLSLIVKRR